jgi:hypothetical protein
VRSLRPLVMPPPPPPSESYLWKFDSSDSEDSDKERVSFTSSAIVSPPSNNDDHVGDGEKFGNVVCKLDHTDKLQPASSKRRSKRKKRSKKTNKTRKEIGPRSQEPCRHHVTFDRISVRFMDRCLGTDTVPGSGSWPLGLSNTVLDDMDVSIDDYEHEKQARLQHRLNALTGDFETVCAHLETRQWDYRSSDRKNPLFGSLHEQDRMNLLLAYSSSAAAATTSEASPLLQEDLSGDHTAASQSGSPPSPPRKMRARSASLSCEQNNIHKSISGRQRSASFCEQFDDTFSQLDVHRIRNELEQIRINRSTDDSAGCTCRKLTVYLLPPGGGGKKAHHKRMNIGDLKKELRKRHILPTDNKTREQLELILHDAVEKEPCCSSDECACVRSGINCQMDVCGCWLPSHQTKDCSKKDTYTLSHRQIIEACGNRYGMYSVDLEKIQAFRLNVLERVEYCQEIQPV